MPSIIRYRPEMTGGLTRRTVIASGLLAVIIGTAFGVLVLSIIDLNGVEERSRRAEEVLVVANQFERLLVDAETGVRGFVITRSEDFLEPWQTAQTDFPDQAKMLEQLVADNPGQLARAQQIAAAGRSYLMDYTVPLVDTVRRDPAAARTVAVTAEGKRRLDAIRAEFDRFLTTEHDLAVARQTRADADAKRAVVAAAAGLAGSILLIGLYTVYLSRAIVRPVRQVAAMAGRLADGDLGTRLPERGVGEIGTLERSFNTMASSLQESRDELAASRARIVAATDQARRQIERDLHDGTQQRLVSLVLDVRAAEAVVPPEMTELRARLAHVAHELGEATDELRELSRGIHPAILSEGGLPPALKALARRSVIPVELEVDVPARLPEPVEVAAITWCPRH
jgi:CHASE3 domain sensor protein